MRIEDLIKVILALRKKYDKTYEIIVGGDMDYQLYIEIYKNNQHIRDYISDELEDLIIDK